MAIAELERSRIATLAGVQGTDFMARDAAFQEYMDQIDRENVIRASGPEETGVTQPTSIPECCGVDCCYIP